MKSATQIIIEFKIWYKIMLTELKTLELDTLNPDRLVWISNLETCKFLLNPVMLDITFPYYVTCNKDKFDYKSRYDAISIGLISDWTKLRNYATKSIQMETYGNATNKICHNCNHIS